MDKPKRSAILLPIKPDQLAKVREAATAAGLPVATWVRMVIIREAGKVRKQTGLNETGSQRP